MPAQFEQINRVILTQEASEKVARMHGLHKEWTTPNENQHEQAISPITEPGYPEKLELVAPRKLKKRGMQNQEGRNILMHAIAHIEFNAINLALDAAYRFRHQAPEFYFDWIQIADDEARHFQMIRDYLNDNDCDYGNYQAHNGLWDMAVRTQHDIVARMALVPRVLEARGLDVTPGIIKRLQNVGDDNAVDILTVIYNDEIAHVETGSRWFFHHCGLRNLEPRTTFIEMVEQHLHGELRGPFNLEARLLAGFDEIEMSALNGKYG